MATRPSQITLPVSMVAKASKLTFKEKKTSKRLNV